MPHGIANDGRTVADIVSGDVLVLAQSPILEGMTAHIQSHGGETLYTAADPHFTDATRYAAFKSASIDGSDQLTMPTALLDIVTGAVTDDIRLNTVVLVEGGGKNKQGRAMELVDGAPAAAGEVGIIDANTLEFHPDDVAAFGTETFIEVFNNSGNIVTVTGGAMTAGRIYYAKLSGFATATGLVQATGIPR